jgi:hypothetical protein
MADHPKEKYPDQLNFIFTDYQKITKNLVPFIEKLEFEQ